MDFNLDDQRILPEDVQEETSAGIFPRFYMETVQNNFKSNEAGRAIFDEVEYVEITYAGDRNSKRIQKVTDVDRRRWAKMYQQFKQGLEPALSGTAIEQWPMISRAKAEEMKHMNIHTVEALAELNDSAIQQMGFGYRKLVEQAKAFLAVANETADVTKIVEENNKLKERVEMLCSQVDDLANHVKNYDDMTARLQSLEIENANMRGPGHSVPAEPILPDYLQNIENKEVELTEPENYKTMTKMQLKALLDIRGVKHLKRDTLDDLVKRAEESDNAV